MSINNNDRLIFALDVPEVSRAKELVLELGDSVSFYKIGMELMMTGDYFSLLDWLVENDKKVKERKIQLVLLQKMGEAFLTSEYSEEDLLEVLGG